MVVYPGLIRLEVLILFDQRSRRFRTAKDRKDMIDKAERKGETLPSTEAFDSNCITPG